MITLVELFESSNKELQTLSQIVGIELDSEGFEFVESPFCVALNIVETRNGYTVYFKYECSDKMNVNSLNNGYYKATIESDGLVYDIESKKENQLINL